jgi:hypothetical protein
MSKKIQFGAILMIVLCGLAACSAPTPPSLTPGPAPTQPSAIQVTPNDSVQNLIDQINADGDPCITTQVVNRSAAALANPGAYFWEFFVNFKERELVPFEPNFDDGEGAKLKISGCFRLYGRGKDTTNTTSSDEIFVFLSEKTVPCYWIQRDNTDKWITSQNLQEVAEKFNVQVTWDSKPFTATVFAEDDQLTCDFHLRQLISDTYQLYQPNNQTLFSEEDTQQLKQAIGEIGVKEVNGAIVSTELYPYLTIVAKGEIDIFDGIGNLINFMPSIHTVPALNQCCEPITLTVQSTENGDHGTEGNFSVFLAGKQYKSIDSSLSCRYPLNTPATLIAHFAPTASINGPIVSGESLKENNFSADYAVLLAYSAVPYEQISVTNRCDPMDTYTQQPIQFWPYTSTVTIGGGFQGALYEVWFDPDDASKK